MKKIRIGSGAGYAGDRIEPALDLIKYGNLDYIMFECLAERTIAIAQQEKLNDPTKGYNNLLEYRFERILPLLFDHKVKIITNMGAANPIAAVKKVSAMAKEIGLTNIKIAAVLGDDIFENISEYMDREILETGEPLSAIADQIVSANAYIGAEKITQALQDGADIVITGRVADPALAVGPLCYEFSTAYDNYDVLGKYTAVGHLLECAGQVSGGYFADPGFKDVPELWNLGFPIAEVDENGEFTISKLENTGGVVSTQTVTEQLLYEIQDPENYFTPDVVADFSKIELQNNGENNVLVTHVSGREKSGLLKVSIGYRDGFIGVGEMSYGGHNSVKRAELALEIVKKRFELLGYEYDEMRFDIIGVNSLYKPNLSEHIVPEFAPIETRIRVAVRTKDRSLADKVVKEVEALYVNGPSAGGGASGKVTPIVSVASIFVPESETKLSIHWEEL